MDEKIKCDSCDQLREKLARLESKSKQTVSHWHEFGPEHGFGVCIHVLDNELRGEKPIDDYTRVLREDAENP